MVLQPQLLWDKQEEVELTSNFNHETNKYTNYNHKIIRIDLLSFIFLIYFFPFNELILNLNAFYSFSILELKMNQDK